MKLLMYVESNLVESITVNYPLVSLPGYLSSLVRELKEKHAPLLAATAHEPEFRVHYPANGVSVPAACPAHDAPVFNLVCGE